MCVVFKWIVLPCSRGQHFLSLSCSSENKLFVTFSCDKRIPASTGGCRSDALSNEIIVHCVWLSCPHVSRTTHYIEPGGKRGQYVKRTRPPPDTIGREFLSSVLIDRVGILSRMSTQRTPPISMLLCEYSSISANHRHEAHDPAAA